jgi:hypothetical protein
MAKVKVRVAVAVDPQGDWASSGFSGQDEAEAHSYCTDHIQPGESRYWLEAEVDIPEPVTVQAEVTPA